MWVGRYSSPKGMKIDEDNKPPVTEDPGTKERTQHLGNADNCPGLIEDWNRKRLVEIADELSKMLDEVVRYPLQLEFAFLPA